MGHTQMLPEKIFSLDILCLYTSRRAYNSFRASFADLPQSGEVFFCVQFVRLTPHKLNTKSTYF